jgi:hypothetical protein
MECFDLERVGDAWFCPEHRPAKKRAPRPAGVSPIEALTELERLIAAENSRTEGACGAAIERWDGDNDDAAAAVEICLEAWRAFHSELGRGLASLKKAITPAKTTSDAAAAESKSGKPRKLKRITPTERQGTGSLMDFEDGATEDAP